MFTGAVPRPVVQQILRTVEFGAWGDVFVCCSGSFRVDRAIKERHPQVRVHSNDVSLLSCGLGALANGQTFPLTFRGRLDFVEAEVSSFTERVAAVLVALEMAQYKGDNAHAVVHFRHYRENFDRYLGSAAGKLAAFLDGLEIESFTPGDFRDQVKRAVETGGGIAAFPPTYKEGYERLYRFVDGNVDWAAPAYRVWDPNDLEGWIAELDELGVRYCVIADKVLPGHTPATVYRNMTNKPVYTYAGNAASSVRRHGHRSDPFLYTAVDVQALGPEAQVKIVPATAQHMNFLKDRYLAKGIVHVAGMMNYTVYLDGRLAGGFIYTRDKSGRQDRIYMLSDFAIARGRKLSKLIATLATCRAVIREIERKLIVRVEGIYTTAFTNHAVSMKYRGIFDLVGRKPGAINYVSAVREHAPNDIYREWFRRYARDAQPVRQAA